MEKHNLYKYINNKPEFAKNILDKPIRKQSENLYSLSKISSFKKIFIVQIHVIEYNFPLIRIIKK
jgi:hypothetical protein